MQLSRGVLAGMLVLAACSKSAARAAGDGAAQDLGGGSHADVAGADDAGTGATITCNGASIRGGQSAGNCTALITGLTIDTSAFALAGGYVYYNVATEIRRLPTAGGASQTFASVPGSVVAMTADTTNLYFVTLAGSGVVGYVPLAGGAAHTLTSAAQSPIAVTVDATDVYWASNGSSLAVHRVSIAGGPVVDIGYADFTGRTIAVDATDVYWISRSSLWQHAKAGAGTDLDGGVSAGATSIVPSVDGDLATDANYVYYTGALTGSWGLSRYNKASSTAEDLDGSNGGTLAIDGANVYYTTRTGLLIRYQTAGRSGQTIASAADYGPIAVDTTSVYEYLPARSEGGPSGIVKIAK